jgi:cell division septum initiation protein DivIVA
MSVDKALEALEQLVGAAKPVPMSASCLVNRQALLDALEDLRRELPAELAEARTVLAGRHDLVAEGHAQAAALVAAAGAEQHRMVGSTEVVEAASREAERLIDAARADADRMRYEVDDYIDSRLATFELVLHKTLGTVGRGRQKIQERHPMAELADTAPDDDAPLPGEEFR